MTRSIVLDKSEFECSIDQEIDLSKAEFDIIVFVVMFYQPRSEVYAGLIVVGLGSLGALILILITMGVLVWMYRLDR